MYDIFLFLHIGLSYNIFLVLLYYNNTYKNT